MSTKSTTAPKHRCAVSVSRRRRFGRSRTISSSPSPERILAFIEGAPVSGSADEIVDCIVSDAGCRNAISFVVTAAAACRANQRAHGTRARRTRPALAWRRLSSILAKRTRLAEKAASGGIDAISAESGENTIVFRSEPCIPPSQAWRAEIVLPPIDTIDAPLVVRVSNRSGKSLPAGTFTICGTDVAIAHGRGSLERQALVDGLATGGVSFTAKGGIPVSGTPVFGSLE